MKTTISAAALAFVIASPAMAQRMVPGESTPSKKAVAPTPARVAIVALQNAVNANDTANIPARVAAAQALATTKEDRYMIAQLQLKAAVTANDTAASAVAVEAIAASGYLDAAKTADLYARVGAKMFEQKKYGQAAGMFQRAASLNPADPKLQLMIADARLAEGRHSDAAAIYVRALEASQTAGQKPEENLYKRAVQAAYDAKLESATELAKAWVKAYPSADSWRNSIAIYRNRTNPDMEGTVDLMRLMRATGALNKPSNELRLYVTALSEQSNFIEAQTAVDQAAAAPGADAAALQSLRAMVSSKPKVTAAELEAASKSAQSGMALLRIADRFYGLGEYAKAAETYRAAKAKGADANLVNLRTGIALAMAGDKPGATAALNQVTGSRAGIAQFWLLHLQGRA